MPDDAHYEHDTLENPVSTIPQDTSDRQKWAQTSGGISPKVSERAEGEL